MADLAINLVYPQHAEDVSHGSSGRQALEHAVFLPTENRHGWQRTYQSIATPLAAAELGRFLFAVVATMQNWRDLLQARAPGYRDRIVHVSLQGDEGGMNLDMPQEVLSASPTRAAWPVRASVRSRSRTITGSAGATWPRPTSATRWR